MEGTKSNILIISHGRVVFPAAKDQKKNKQIRVSGGRKRCPLSSPESKKEGEGQEERRFLGVRKRSSGRFAAEIRNPNTGKKVWLGTYDNSEEAATAYDAAAVDLRRLETRTNALTAGGSAQSEGGDTATATAGSLPRALAACSVANAGRSKSSRVYCCSICGKEFGSPQALGGHARTHKTSAARDTSASSGFLF